ncbi:hypothetical protein PMI35_00124 [Pseudomonas sp. GM78]|uniref:hypothetical protein n=1 Tax=Pseudomonas sp. GM78 TaxID=1144337 RepID=UPI00026F8E8B|nr:hypothetical protein [Pseudomonas sp. GM78]EJN35574.1 hypothetical protein PMI35_00124 [Pseudomonas sp. GM78]
MTARRLPTPSNYTAGNRDGACEHTAIADGRVFMVGWSRSPDYQAPPLEIQCIDRHGAWDKNFGDNGRVIVRNTSDRAPSMGGATVIKTLASGSIIAGANYTTGTGAVETATLLKFDALGFPVRTFGNDGRVEIKLPDAAASTSLNHCHILDNGRILVAGLAQPLGELKQGLLVMLNPDGTLNSKFGIGGFLLIGRPNADTGFYAIAQQDSNKFQVAGGAGQSRQRELLIDIDDRGSLTTPAIRSSVSPPPCT